MPRTIVRRGGDGTCCVLRRVVASEKSFPPRISFILFTGSVSHVTHHLVPFFFPLASQRQALALRHKVKSAQGRARSIKPWLTQVLSSFVRAILNRAPHGQCPSPRLPPRPQKCDPSGPPIFPPPTLSALLLRLRVEQSLLPRRPVGLPCRSRITFVGKQARSIGSNSRLFTTRDLNRLP